MKRVLTLKEQEKRARLIAPFFQYLRTSKQFYEDTEVIRVKYWISRATPALEHVPVHLLSQPYWNREFESMKIVKHYWPVKEEAWVEFHQDIESLAKKYRVSNFPDLIKEFVLTERFGNALLIHRVRLTDDGHTIELPRSIKKAEFDSIWKDIEQYNKDYPMSRSRRKYSDEVNEKYKSVEKIENKYFADQKGIRLLMIKELFGNLSPEEEMEINSWDKYKKSRLVRLNKVLFSLVQDLDEAES